ncbi:MAG: hypothetical protein AB7O95_01880 [Geminicoccaceae bacterium]
MAFINGVWFRSAASGTSDFTDGTAESGHENMTAAGCVNGQPYSYKAISDDRTQWEYGRGNYNSGSGLIARTTIFHSSNANAKVNFTAAPKVYLSPLQADFDSLFTDPVITGAIKEDVHTITDGAAFEIDPGNGSIQIVTLGANRTPAASNFQAGESVTLMIADGTSYAITWSTVAVVWVGGSAPTLATSGYTVVELWKVGSTIYGAHTGDVA